MQSTVNGHRVINPRASALPIRTKYDETVACPPQCSHSSSSQPSNGTICIHQKPTREFSRWRGIEPCGLRIAERLSVDVDVKETDRGFIVMEVNDNPNLEHGIEDQVGKDEIWVRVLKWFIERFEQ